MAENEPAKPDFSKGVPFSSIPEGNILSGMVGDEPVLLTRAGEDVRAFSSKCTHLSAPLEQGLVVAGEIRCPWHHACFSLRSGEATRAPGFDPLPRWSVERQGDVIYVRDKIAAAQQGMPEPSAEPGLVIVGGGAAGYAAAHEARRLGYAGAITMVSTDCDPPYDRTLLTKDFLDGAMGEDRLPIARTSLADLGVTLLLRTEAVRIDTAAKRLHLRDREPILYDKLLIATGAEPKRPDLPGADMPHVHLLRSADDCRRILAALRAGTRLVVIGGSFIGMEAAASIRSQGFEVTVVTPDPEPFAKILGPDLSRAIVAVHRKNGVVLRTQTKVEAIDRDHICLVGGGTIPADVVLLGVGVAPRVRLAEESGLEVDNGVVVDAVLRTSVPDVFAAGDVARWPDPHSGRLIRVEHWVVAERQGQAAARAMLGQPSSLRDVPFFWSKHFDFSFRYVGHAESWDEIAIEGDLSARKAVLSYLKDGKRLAVATVENDLRALEVEREFETDSR